MGEPKKNTVVGQILNTASGGALSAAEGVATTFANNAEQTARASALNDATKDPNLDPTTKQELQSLYDSGASSDQIAALLNKAREGKGIYAVRRLNMIQQAVSTDLPGRSQILSLSNPNPLGMSTTTGGGK